MLRHCDDGSAWQFMDPLPQKQTELQRLSRPPPQSMEYPVGVGADEEVVVVVNVEVVLVREVVVVLLVADRNAACAVVKREAARRSWEGVSDLVSGKIGGIPCCLTFIFILGSLLVKSRD